MQFPRIAKSGPAHVALKPAGHHIVQLLAALQDHVRDRVMNGLADDTRYFVLLALLVAETAGAWPDGTPDAARLREALR
jgi:hypothetical protein